MSEDRPTHPTAEELRALSLGQLAEEELDRICDHLEACPECCHRIDRLADTDPLLARLQQTADRLAETQVGRVQRRSAVHAVRRRRAARAAAQREDSRTEPTILPAPKRVGDYEILAEVGRGGMGVVYQARHRGLDRLAALKMVLAGEFASPAQVRRFQLEAELAARVQHPNIVQIYEIGSYERHPFLAMEWVEGGSLADRLDGQPWCEGEAASLLETLARAIHVAHTEGVVHRDLKPANILLQAGGGGKKTDQGESSRSGSSADTAPGFLPKITDFGLARPIEGGEGLTQSGLLVGTPGYMAPEQAGGGRRRALVGPATDIYALGVILYQLLTGRLPFRGDSTLDVLRAVTSDEPVRPRHWQPRLSLDLEAITLHCLEKEPTCRYSSALALAEDLKQFQEGQPVAVRPVGSGARLARACRRRPLVVLLFGLLTASMFGGLAGVTWKWLEADAQRDLANAQGREALFQAYRARLAAAAAALQNHDVTDAARHLDAAPEGLRGWEWRQLHSRLDESSSVTPLPDKRLAFLLGTPDRLRAGAFTSDGLRLTDLESGEHRILPISRHRGRFPDFTVTPTRRGLRVAAWVGNSAFDLLDEAGRLLVHVERPGNREPHPVVMSPDGTRMAAHWDDGEWRRLVVFDATTGKPVAVCEGHHAGIYGYTFSPDGTRLASVGEDQTARLWDPATGALIATCRGHAAKVIAAAFRPDGARLVTSSGDGTVRQWDAATGREVEPPYDRHSGEVATAVYSPDGQWVASAGADRTIRVWRSVGRQDVAVLHGHTGAAVGVVFAQNGRRLASLSIDHAFGYGVDDTVRVWDLDPRATLPVLRGHTNYVYPVAFSPDGNRLASGSWDGTAFLWDGVTGEPFAALPHPGAVPSLTFTPDGRWLVTGNYGDRRLRVWDAATARLLKEISDPAGSPPFVTLGSGGGRDNASPEVLRFLIKQMVIVSPDGRRVAATAFDPQIRFHLCVRDLTSGERLFAAEGAALAYSPDGRWLAVRAPDETTVLLLDARTYQTAGRFVGHEKGVVSATFSPDGRYLASCSLDRTVRLWPIDGSACRVLRGHTDDVFAAAFHPDGTRLATAGRDRAVWLWDLARGEEVARLPGHTSYIWSLAFSPDGATLASGSGDFTVRLWDTAPVRARYQARHEAEALRSEAERLVGRLWRQNDDPAAVLAALRADRALSEPLRQAALRAVLQRSQPPEAVPANPRDPL
jgi:WD40 repeat protein/serine/threonine protein kinase